MYVCVFARLGEDNHELVRGLPLQLIVRANTEGAARLGADDVYYYNCEAMMMMMFITITARLGYRSASCLDHHVKHK